MTRTKHIAFALGVFERMSDDELQPLFTDDGKPMTIEEIRQYISELRAQGCKYMPCPCEQINDDGSCKGWDKEAAA